MNADAQASTVIATAAAVRQATAERGGATVVSVMAFLQPGALTLPFRSDGSGVTAL